MEKKEIGFKKQIANPPTLFVVYKNNNKKSVRLLPLFVQNEISDMNF